MNATATLATIQDAARSDRTQEAETMLRGFLSTLFPLAIASVEVRRDSLSLNSVNGFIRLSAPDPKSGASVLFFKFHHEENEEVLKEYYNSKLLSENGFPVEVPVYASHEVGKQVLLYPYKDSERMADACKRLDERTQENDEMRSVLLAQEALDTLSLARYMATLHEAPLAKLEEEPILQLFHHRLVDAGTNTGLGGRFREFYAGKEFEFSGRTLRYDELASLHWRINGVAYNLTLGEAFARSLALLSPKAHLLPGKSTYPALVAHGDAHNGNVWMNAGKPPALSLFDPAFAGPHIPALLAEIKSLFHNIFAHPLWLYDAQEADAKLSIRLDVEGGYMKVEHNWELSLLRRRFLEIKREALFKPLISGLRERKWLPDTWQGYMRCALFCCPTLVMNLRAHAGNARNFHTPKTSLLSLCVAMTMASAPAKGHDTVSDFFEALG
jgi:hypothetical protein